jgi:hypothetical protein
VSEFPFHGLVFRLTILIFPSSPQISPNIVLSDDLDRQSLIHLLDNGLWSRCGNLRTEWTDQREVDRIKLANEEKLEMQKRQDEIDAQVERFRVGLPIALAKMALKHYPYVSTSFHDYDLTGTQNSGGV